MSYLKATELIRANQLIEEGKFDDALKVIISFEEKGDLSLYNQMICNLLKCSLYYLKRDRVQSLEFAEKAFFASQELKLDDSLQLFDIFLMMANSLNFIDKIDEAHEFFDKSEDLLMRLYQEPQKELKKRKAYLAYVKAYTLTKKTASTTKGDFEKALEYALEALTLRKEIGLDIYILQSFSQIGRIYFWMGNLKETLEYTEKTLKIAEKLNLNLYILRCNMGFGMVYSLQGELDKALEYNQKSLSLAKEENKKREICYGLNNIGLVYQMQGDLDQAMKYIEEALLISEDIKHFNVIGILDSLFHLNLDKKDVDQARYYLKRIKEHRIGISDNILYRVNKALLLKTSPRAIYRGKAEKILRQVINEIDIEGREILYETKINALTNLCDLLLTELRNTGDLEVLKELQEIIIYMIIIAEKNNSYSLLAEIYLLKARLASINFDLKDARRFLTQAQQIAERHGLNQLVRKISSEQTNKFIRQLDSWEKLKESDMTLQERIELANIDDQVERIIRNRVLLTQVAEQTVTIHADRKICLICRGEIVGYMYTCTCDAIYCENCARALTDLENACWACSAPLDTSKPTKPYQEEKAREKGDKHIIIDKK